MKADCGLYLVLFLLTAAYSEQATTTPRLSEVTTPQMVISSNDNSTNNNETELFDPTNPSSWDILDYFGFDEADLYFKGPVCDEFYSSGSSFEEDMKIYQNCEYIHGSLVLYMSFADKGRDYKNVSFPSIRQVSGHVIIYDTHGFDSLDSMFPNLAVIGGNTLYKGYSLVVMQNKDLKRLGLKNLSHIRNGMVRIQNNENLCYLSTINWQLIGIKHKKHENYINQTKTILFNKGGGCLDLCKNECNGHCWDYNVCQKPACPKECPDACSEDAQTCHCHPQCLGGCSHPNDPSSCFGCANNVNLNGTCVKECGEDEYLSEFGNICMDRERCINTYGVLFDDKCVIRCPSGYELTNATDSSNTSSSEPFQTPYVTCIKCTPPKQCPIKCGETLILAEVEDLATAERWRGCEVIVPRLEFTMDSSSDINDETYDKLEEIFGEVYQLSTLVVKNTNLQSLKFFKKLKTITGDHEFTYKEGNKSYSLLLLDNKVLDELWYGKADDDTGKLQDGMNTAINGYVYAHFNPHLCNSIIEYVTTASTGDETNIDISEVSNSPECTNIWIDVWVSATMMSSNVGESVAWFYWKDPGIPRMHNFGYILYYKISESQNATRLRRDEIDTCGVSRWSTVAVQFNQLHVRISELRPNTQYAYYIKCKVPITTNTKVESHIQYFNTSVAVPKAPDYFIANTMDKSSIKVSWMTPSVLSGPFSHYRVRVTRLCEDTSQMIIRYSGCSTSMADQTTSSRKTETPVEESTSKYYSDALKTCQEMEIQNSEIQYMFRIKERKEMKDFENGLVDKIYPSYTYKDIEDENKTTTTTDSDKAGNSLESLIGKRRRRDTEEIVEDGPDKKRPGPNDTIQAHSALYKWPTKIVGPDPHLEENTEKNKKYGPIEFTVVDESAKASHLQVITNYPHNLTNTCAQRSTWHSNETCKEEIFELRTKETSITIDGLCHYTDYRITLMTCVFDPACGKTYCTDSMSSSTTTTRTMADTSVDRVENLRTESNKTNTYVQIVKFDPPRQPNGFIKYYNMIYRKQGSDKTNIKCCSTWEFNEKKMCELEINEIGEWELQVKPISLYDGKTDNITTWVPFTITTIQKQQHMLEIVILCLAALLGFVTLGIVIYVKKGHRDSSKRATYLMTVNPEYTSVGTYQPDAYEISINKVSTSRKIGTGHFGEVYEGLAKDIVAGEEETKVAIKTLIGTDNPIKRQEFLKEANTMKAFNSYHVVRLLGVVSMTDKPMVIMEYMHYGDLKSYLRNSRPDCPEESERIPPITYEHKLQMCCEIADGMAYLSDCKFVHRDLAARNCLVHSNLTVKIGDFGLTRDVYETDYYRIESRGIMPVRWMSPESLKDGVFNSRSDVWSYGIVLWEIATLSEQPYQGKQHDQVTRYVIDGGYMERPKDCPDRLYELMTTCWLYNPSMRPTFLEIVSLLSNDVSESFKEHAYFYERSRNKETNMEIMEETDALPIQEKDPLLLGNDVTIAQQYQDGKPTDDHVILGEHVIAGDGDHVSYHQQGAGYPQHFSQPTTHF